MKDDREGSYEMLESDLLEYLALVDQQSKKHNSINGVTDKEKDEDGGAKREYTYSEPWWDDYHQKVDVWRERHLHGEWAS